MRKVLSILVMIAWSISAFSSSTYWIPFFSHGMVFGPTVKGVVLDQEDCFDGPYKNNTIFTIKVLDDFPKDVIGCYWSSSLDSITPDNAWMLYFDRDSICIRNTSRSIGMFTCPVCP